MTACRWPCVAPLSLAKRTAWSRVLRMPSLSLRGGSDHCFSGPFRKPTSRRPSPTFAVMRRDAWRRRETPAGLSWPSILNTRRSTSSGVSPNLPLAAIASHTGSEIRMVFTAIASFVVLKYLSHYHAVSSGLGNNIIWAGGHFGRRRPTTRCSRRRAVGAGWKSRGCSPAAAERERWADKLSERPLQ